MPANNIDGMRRDVIEALRPMRISVLRYPGGCYADYYHWQDGIGPRDKRPERWSTAWHEWNSNDFGTDEYMELARLLKFQGHITTNYISGTAKEAADWVEYTNGSADTPMVVCGLRTDTQNLTGSICGPLAMKLPISAVNSTREGRS